MLIDPLCKGCSGQICVCVLCVHVHTTSVGTQMGGASWQLAVCKTRALDVLLSTLSSSKIDQHCIQIIAHDCCHVRGDYGPHGVNI